MPNETAQTLDANTCDVAIIGGGPAGTTAATFLQRQGHRCVILEAAVFPRYHVGESLIPHTFGTLDRLGLLPKLRDSSYPVKHSVRFVSPSGTESDPFYFSETIEGQGATTWQVTRDSFDQMCLDHARDNGVDVRENSPVGQVLFKGDRAVGVRVSPRDGQAYDLHASVVVDASGRVGMIGRQLDLREPVEGLDKAAAWTYYRGAKRREGIDAGETTVFMMPGRDWFWYIPMADDIVSVGIVADPERLPHQDIGFDAAFEHCADRCPQLREYLQGAERIDRVRGIPRLAYRHRQTVGQGWVMVGDCAAFLDPIYSSGIFLAIVSGEMAADCIHEALAADDVSADRLGKFAGPLFEGVDVIHRLIQAFYHTGFSFADFARAYPQHRAALIDCLVGDVVGKDMSDFLAALDEATSVDAASA